jgi:2-amino-4-hydroxy-6-hydroxymethyldihydropteridine diphosphokinase
VTVTCYIALGGNIGQPRDTFRQAARLLAGLGQAIADHSALYQTASLGGPPGQPDFLNAALTLRTGLPARELLVQLQAIEAQCGRAPGQHWGPRPLDLDILLYGPDIISEPHLTVPHPRLHERLFVLAPLVDVAADVVHPVLGRTIREIHDQLAAAGGQRVARLEPRGWLFNM